MQECCMLAVLHLESISNGNNRSLQPQLCRFNSIKKNGPFHPGELVSVSAVSVLYLQSERASHLYTHGCVWVSERKTTKKICHCEKVKRSLSIPMLPLLRFLISEHIKEHFLWFYMHIAASGDFVKH